MQNPELSIVIPVYNEEGNLLELYKRLIGVLENELHVTYEIIFIEDGEDNSWQIIEKLNDQNINVKGIKFSRRFGHQNALKAGFDYSSGNAVISMDADLQHPPEMLIDLYNKWNEGYKIVQAIRKDTKGVNIFKELNSRIFYKIINFLSDVKIDRGSSDFRLLDRQIVEELKKLNENQFFLRGVIPWLGFNKMSIEYIAQDRFSGETKYTIKRMVNFAIDGIMSFSIKPLRIATILGLIISIVSFIYGLIVIYLKIFTNINVPGLSSILLSILFLGGIQLIVLGIIGEYIGKIFEGIKGRSSYIIKEKRGLK